MAHSDLMFKRFVIVAVLLIGAGVGKLLWTTPTPMVHAQSSSYPVYVEPGVFMLRAPDGSRQVLGKVIIDLRNGNVWGFPTTVEQPFPVDVMQSKPPTSTPFRLGRYDFSVMDQQ